MTAHDQIIITGLAISSFIGASDDEQKRPQRLKVSIVMDPMRGFKGLGDELKNTIDYAKVAQGVKSLASTGKRRLIETLAEEIAHYLLVSFPLAAVEVEVQKFVLPDTDFVSVKTRMVAPRESSVE